MKLTLEQQFQLATLKKNIRKLTLEQAQDFLIEMFEQSMIKDNLLKEWMKSNL